MVIGSISTADLVPTLKRLEQSFQREINVTVARKFLLDGGSGAIMLQETKRESECLPMT
jgi:hypothetical protein